MKRVTGRKGVLSMRLRTRVLAILVVIISLQISSSEAIELSIFPHEKEQPSNAFRGEGRALKAQLFSFKISGWGSFKVERFAFRLYLKGEAITSGANYELYKDVDQDGVIKSEVDQKVGGPGKLISRYVVFFEPFSISGDTSFLVRADFLKLAPGFQLTINIDFEETVIKDKDGNKIILKLGARMYSGEHSEPYPVITARVVPRSAVIVGNQDINIFVDISYLRGVEPFWADLHKIPGWEIKGVPRMSEVQGFDLIRQRVFIILAQKPGMTVGKYTIPELVLHYRDTGGSDSKLQTGKVRTAAFTIRKELAHAEVSILPRRISLADPLSYELRLFLDPDYKVPDDYLDELRLREFWGEFKVSSPTLKVFKEEGLGVTSFKAVLSYLGPPTKEAVLPKEKVPYIKVDDVSRGLLVYNLPEVKFPVNSIVVRQDFDGPEMWRNVGKEEAKFFGQPLSFLTSVVPLWVGGALVLYLGIREVLLALRRRKSKVTSFFRRLKAKIRLHNYLFAGGSEVGCYEVSLAIREYIGAVVGKPKDFVRSAIFVPWLKERYPDETGLLETLNRIERLMQIEDIDKRMSLSTEEKRRFYKAPGRIGRKESIARLRRLFSLISLKFVKQQLMIMIKRVGCD